MRIYALAVAMSAVLITSCGSDESSSNGLSSHLQVSQDNRKVSVSFTELNIKWFGAKETIVDNQTPQTRSLQETRTKSIRKFLSDNKLLSDVMIFEEIVDVDLLQSDVLGKTYQCHSYENSDAKHQHVVICHKNNYIFSISDDDENYSLESVNVSGRLRPAVHGILKTKNNKHIAHVFGVHLKANPNMSDVRLNQVNKLVEYINNQEDRSDPIIVMGDYNTYNEDPAAIEKIFKKAQMTELEIPKSYTWASSSEEYEPAKFDRVWMSKNIISKVKSSDIKGPCNSGDKKLIAEYNQKVSDHCPVTLTIEQ